MQTMPSVEAQNSFGTLIDKAQREIISVTRRGRPVALVMSPEVLGDYIDGILALQAESNGLLSEVESKKVLDKFRNA